MNKNLLFRLTLVVTVVAALFLSGCGGDSIEQQRLSKEAEGTCQISVRFQTRTIN